MCVCVCVIFFFWVVGGYNIIIIYILKCVHVKI